MRVEETQHTQGDTDYFLTEHFHRLSVSTFQDKPLDFALTLISDKCLRFTLAFNKAAGDHYPVTTFYYNYFIAVRQNE